MRIRTVLFLSLFLAPLIASAAAPTINPGGVVNVASYAPAGLLKAALGQGSLAAIFGSGIGPASIAYASYPLPKSLANTSVQIISGATTVNAFMIYTSASQVAILLPSNTPAGTDLLTLTFNGQTSAPVTIQVVPSSFGIFTQNQQGFGPGVIQNFISESNQPFNDILHPALGGQVEILWGTGLAPYAGDESEPPVAGNIGNNVQVFVGGVSAKVDYSGPSPCCGGEAQIVFDTPSGVSGCYTPVDVVANGLKSPSATMAISPTPGAPCSDANGYSAAELQALQSQPTVSIGYVDLVRTDQKAFGTNPETITDSGRAFFGSFPTAAVLANPPFLQPYISSGFCATYTFAGTNGDVNQKTYDGASRFLGSKFNAGSSLALSSSDGSTRALPQSSLGVGQYSGTLGRSPGTPSPFLNSGRTIQVQSNGPDVGALTASVSLPAVPLAITSPTGVTIPLNQDLTVRWAGGGSNDFVAVNGYSFNSTGTAGTGFVCSAPNSAGSVTVSAPVLSVLPASSPSRPGVLEVIDIPPPTRSISGSGLENIVDSALNDVETVEYQ